MSLLANEFDVRSILHGQVSLAAVNQIRVVHEAMDGCKKTKDALKGCFININRDKLMKFSFANSIITRSNNLEE